MILGLRMLHCHSLQRCFHWWKSSDWVALTSWLSNCGHHFLCLSAGSNSMWHGPAGRCWLVLLLFRSSTYPCALFSWCYVLVDHFEWNVSPHSLSCVLLGKITRALQYGIWRARVRGWVDGAGVGEVHVSPCLCCGVESVWQQSNPRSHHAGEDRGCCWSICLCRFVQWRAACPHRSFCQLLGKWAPCKTGAVPNIRSPIAEALPSADGCVSVGSLDPFSMTEFVVNRLKGAKIRFSMASRPALRRAIITNDLSTPDWCDGEPCQGIAIGVSITEGDWLQKWWR